MIERINFHQSRRKFPTWSLESPLWWIMYRTDVPGRWSTRDIEEFNKLQGRYVIFLDHKDDPKARELALYLLERSDHFMAAKVSKYARDGEKVLVLLAKHGKYYDELSDFVKEWGMLVFRFKPLSDITDHEKEANIRWGDYLTKLALAFAPPK